MSVYNDIKVYINGLPLETEVSASGVAFKFGTNVTLASVYLSRFKKDGYLLKLSKGCYKKFSQVPEDAKMKNDKPGQGPKPFVLFDEIKNFINSLPLGDIVTTKSVAGMLSINKVRTVTYLSIISKEGFIKRVKTSTYEIIKRIPESFKLTHKQPYNSLAGKVDPGEKKNIENVEDDNEDKNIIGKRAVSSIITLLATNGMSKVICDKGLTFKVHIKGRCIEKNYQGDVLKFSLDCVEISVCDD